MSFVTFENFYDEIKFFCMGQAKKADGLGLVLTGIDHPNAEAWINYAEDRGWHQRAEFFARMLRSGNSLTMPCANPKDFDPGYIAQPRQPKRANYETKSMTPEERRRVIESAMRGFVRNPYDPKRRDNEPERPKSHAEILAGLKEKGEKEPVALSAELADRLGITPSAHPVKQGEGRAA